MRILTVCSNYRVFGAETITLKMLEGFKQHGHEQVAVTSFQTDGEFSRRLQGLGIREEVMPLGAVVLKFRYISWTLYTLTRLPILWWQWRQVQRTFRPDVVLWTSSKQVLLLLPFLHQTPNCLIEYTNVAATKGILWLYRLLARRLSCFVGVSNFMRSHLQVTGAPSKKIVVIRSGTFFEKDKLATEQAVASFVRTQSMPFRIGFVGQVAPNKGHDCLIEAVRLLRRRERQLRVQIFGSGDPQYVIHLKNMITKANLTDVWNWMGYERDKVKIFGSMDVCVVPSCFGDSFPTVAMEAGVYGLPVVASRIGGLPEIIDDGVTGWLVEPNSPAQLADRLEWLIKNPKRAREMGSGGRERVFQNFTVEKMVAEFEALFKEYLKNAN